MADREKVLKGLECCSGSSHNCVKECPYDFVNNDNCMGDMARDALELLRDEPSAVLNVEKFNCYHGNCPVCGKRIHYKNTNYCPYCGKRVKWG